MAKERLHQRLRKLRIEQGYSQQQIADHLGLCSAYITMVESGNRRLSNDKIRKFAKLVGVDMEDLLDCDIKVPTKELQKKVDSDPNFMRLLRLLIATRRPTKVIINFINRTEREAASQ